MSYQCREILTKICIIKTCSAYDVMKKDNFSLKCSGHLSVNIFYLCTIKAFYINLADRDTNKFNLNSLQGVSEYSSLRFPFIYKNKFLSLFRPNCMNVNVGATYHVQLQSLRIFSQWGSFRNCIIVTFVTFSVLLLMTHRSPSSHVIKWYLP